MIKYDKKIAPDLRDQFYRETKNLQFHFKLGGALYWLIETNRGNPISLWTHKKMEEYPLMSQLAKALLLIPYSSACVERTFSDFKTIKTNKRNCLCRESLEACLLIYQAFRQETVKITEDMIQRYDIIWLSKKKLESQGTNSTMEIENIDQHSGLNEQEPIAVQSLQRTFKKLIPPPSKSDNEQENVEATKK